MTFNTEAVKDGRGRVIRVDASTDHFATITYRWGDMAGVLDGTNQYAARILSLGAIRRGFANDRIAASGTTDLSLDNADGGLDGIAGRESISTQKKLRFRIYVALYDPAASPLVFTSKLLGEFTLSDWVRQNNTTLSLQLADDIMGDIARQVALPTLNDWQAVGTTANNPIKTAMGIPSAVSEFAPLQLAFGEDWVHALPHIIPWNSPEAAYLEHVIVPLYVTTDLGAVSQDLITNLRVRWMSYSDVGDVNGGVETGEQLRDIPRTVEVHPAFGTAAAETQTIWRVEKSPTITKDGRNFSIVYVVVRAHLGMLIYSGASSGNWDTTDLGAYQNNGGYPLGAINFAGPDYRVTASRVLDWYVKGTPLSSRYGSTTSLVKHPIAVLTSLVENYSEADSITIDSLGADRVAGGNRNAACAGVIQSWVSGPKKGESISLAAPSPSLRQAISEICQSSDIDVFINWSGEFAFSADIWDFETATQAASLIDIPEEWVSGMERWIPSPGERWAPYNRLMMVNGKSDPANGVYELPYQGPWDFESNESSITLADGIVEESLSQGWRPYRQQALAPWYWRAINTAARDMIQFRTHLGGLLLELGQYFTLSWTRGPSLGGPYTAATFQVETITYPSADDSVDITAVWRDDVTTERQYLLDDETLLVRAKSALTGSCTTSVGTGVTFGGTINLTTMGVVAGDLLILRDTTEAADLFTRNIVARIVSVDSTTTATLAVALVNVAAVANADWSIVRGALTYPTAISDVTNYPSGGDMYGKVTNTAGSTNQDVVGNRLISG